jgi:hypothetical protein
MYRRPKVLEVLLDIRRTMAAEADHDIDIFISAVRSGDVPEPVAAPETAAVEDLTTVTSDR